GGARDAETRGEEGVRAGAGLRHGEVAPPDAPHAVLRLLPRRVHEGELPASPLLPAGDLVRVAGADLVVLGGLAAERALIGAVLRGDVVRRHLAGLGMLPPGEPRLVVEVDADAVGVGPVLEGPLGDAGRRALEDV